MRHFPVFCGYIPTMAGMSRNTDSLQRPEPGHGKNSNKIAEREGTGEGGAGRSSPLHQGTVWSLGSQRDTVPSQELLKRSPGRVGCQLTSLVVLWCPVSFRWISPVRMSYTKTFPHLLPVATKRSPEVCSGDHSQRISVSKTECPRIVSRL